MAGKIIVIEGLDGSGKATQTDLLYKKLLEQGKNVKKLTFPCYESESSALVRMYLGGELGSNPDSVNPYQASAFYAVDRVASFLKDWKSDYENGTIFLCDRYSTSNAIYQLSKLNESEYEDFLNWLNDFEHNKLGIPRADYVVYLDMPTEVSQKLMSKRYKGDEGKKDVHEVDVEFLNSCRESALYTAKKQGWHIVPCSDGENVYSIEQIHNDIVNIVKEELKNA